MVDWTQAYMSGGRAAGAEATTGFNALLQLHGDDAVRHFLLDQQPDVVDGAEPVAPAAASRSVHLYADNQYSSYGDVPAAPMTKPFSQQHFSGLFGSSTRNFSDMPSALPMTTKPLLLQAWEHKAFKSNKEPVQDTCSSATRRSVPENSPPAAAKKPRIATPSPLPTFKVCTGRPPACDAIRRDYIIFHLQLSGQLLISSSTHAIQAGQIFSLAMMTINWIMIAFDNYSPRAGEEREARGQNHRAPATGLAFWKDGYCIGPSRGHRIHQVPAPSSSIPELSVSEVRTTCAAATATTDQGGL
ncbi:hypothetical protein C2845_PM06G17280 [Panicum miliaceum]|uniref:Uncharacterized protein n=1 Tax=Panicum miliaceum TaxID=4540 RepID=A0A3L6R5Z5_PANMI|nr:hypothetical protein C2845_PM06G17280 [Panicum miliaceum]